MVLLLFLAKFSFYDQKKWDFLAVKKNMPLIFCNSRCVYLGKIVPLETLTLDCFSSTSVQKEPNNAGCGYRSESKGLDIQLRVGECSLKTGVDTILMWQTNEEEEARRVAEKCRQGVSCEMAPVDFFFSFWATWDHLGHSYLFRATVEFSQKMVPSFSSSFRCDTDNFLTCVCVCVWVWWIFNARLALCGTATPADMFTSFIQAYSICPGCHGVRRQKRKLTVDLKLIIEPCLL